MSKKMYGIPSHLLEKLIDQAIESRVFAYAPYSNFHVGSAILTENDQIFSGCNIENASFGLSICAERVALYKALSSGAKIFFAIAIAAHQNEKVLPCGSCRQVLYEFSPELLVVSCNLKRDYIIYTLKELFPAPFHNTIIKQ